MHTLWMRSRIASSASCCVFLDFRSFSIGHSSLKSHFRGRKWAAISNHRVAAEPLNLFNNFEILDENLRLRLQLIMKAALVLLITVLECSSSACQSQNDFHVVDSGRPCGPSQGLKTTMAKRAKARARVFQTSVIGSGLGQGYAGTFLINCAMLYFQRRASACLSLRRC